MAKDGSKSQTEKFCLEAGWSVGDIGSWFEYNKIHICWMIIRNGKDWLQDCLKYKKHQLSRMQMRSGAYLNMETITFILPVFPA